MFKRIERLEELKQFLAGKKKDLSFFDEFWELIMGRPVRLKTGAPAYSLERKDYEILEINEFERTVYVAELQYLLPFLNVTRDPKVLVELVNAEFPEVVMSEESIRKALSFNKVIKLKGRQYRKRKEEKCY